MQVNQDKPPVYIPPFKKITITLETYKDYNEFTDLFFTSLMYYKYQKDGEKHPLAWLIEAYFPKALSSK